LRVGIVGLGLIGGSLARDLAGAGHEVWGADLDGGAVRAARRSRVIAGAFAPEDEAWPALDACILAVPVDVAAALLVRHAAMFAAIRTVTDVGSTKRSIVRAAAAGRVRSFVGSHPLAGDHRSGWAAGRRGLFRGSRVFVTPGRRPMRGAVARVQALWRTVGAVPAVVTPAEHDRAMAYVSHAPQVVSSALALALDRAGVSRAALGRGGRDVTRLAGSNARMWSAILIDNRQQVARAVRRVVRALSTLEGAVRAGDAARVGRALRAANRWSGTSA
jgi:prephenate dehydrogenase